MKSILLFQKTLGAIDKVECLGEVAEVHFSTRADAHQVIHLCLLQVASGKILSKEPIAAILSQTDMLFSQAIHTLETERKLIIPLEAGVTLLEFFFLGELEKKFQRTFYLKEKKRT